MKEIVLNITGTMPLLMHNERLANPLDEYAKAIKAITSKRNKTEDDYKEIERLEWYGGLYYSDTDGPYLKTASVRKCLVNAGKTRKLGTAVQRSVLAKGLDVPILYSGTRDKDKLWPLPQHRDVRAVGIQSARTMRCRPQFPDWEVRVPMIVMTETLNFEDFEAIVRLAGIIEGLGDGRSIGFGRFEAEITGAK